MKAVYVPNHSPRMTVTELVLPAAWEIALETGLTEGMPEDHARLVERIRFLFGELALVSPDVEYRHDHDALEAGVSACDCCVYAFIEHHEASLH